MTWAGVTKFHVGLLRDDPRMHSNYWINSVVADPHINEHHPRACPVPPSPHHSAAASDTSAAQRFGSHSMPDSSPPRHGAVQTRIAEQAGPPPTETAPREPDRAPAQTHVLSRPATASPLATATASGSGRDDGAAPKQAARAGSTAEDADTDVDGDAAAADEDAGSSGDSHDAAGQEDVDEWLHDVLQRVQPGCEITVHALHMLGDLFETVCLCPATTHMLSYGSGPMQLHTVHRVYSTEHLLRSMLPISDMVPTDTQRFSVTARAQPTSGMLLR